MNTHSSLSLSSHSLLSFRPVFPQNFIERKPSSACHKEKWLKWSERRTVRTHSLSFLFAFILIWAKLRLRFEHKQLNTVITEKRDRRLIEWITSPFVSCCPTIQIHVQTRDLFVFESKQANGNPSVTSSRQTLSLFLFCSVSADAAALLKRGSWKAVPQIWVGGEDEGVTFTSTGLLHVCASTLKTTNHAIALIDGQWTQMVRFSSLHLAYVQQHCVKDSNVVLDFMV